MLYSSFLVLINLICFNVMIFFSVKVIYLFVGRAASEQLIQELFNVMNISQLPERMVSSLEYYSFIRV